MATAAAAIDHRLWSKSVWFVDTVFPRRFDQDGCRLPWIRRHTRVMDNRLSMENMAGCRGLRLHPGVDSFLGPHGYVIVIPVTMSDQPRPGGNEKSY